MQLVWTLVQIIYPSYFDKWLYSVSERVPSAEIKPQSCSHASNNCLTISSSVSPEPFIVVEFYPDTTQELSPTTLLYIYLIYGYASDITNNVFLSLFIYINFSASISPLYLSLSLSVLLHNNTV